MATNAVKSFAPKKFEDHTIVDHAGQIVGHIRVKPSGILWAPKNGKVWYGLTLKAFSDFAEQNGTKQQK